MGHKFKFLHKELGLETHFGSKELKENSWQLIWKDIYFENINLHIIQKKSTNSEKKPIKCGGVFSLTY